MTVKSPPGERGAMSRRRSYVLCGSIAVIAIALAGTPARAQGSPEMRAILDRLDRIEAQNRELVAEIRELKSELETARNGGSVPQPEADQTAAQSSLEQRVEVQESRTAEQASTKVEAAHRFPIRVTGMALFNTFYNSQGSGGFEYPTIAYTGRDKSGGATLRQTVIGLDYNGPRTFAGGAVSGSLRMDFLGSGGSGLDQALRLRTGTIRIDWKNRSLMGGVDKPLISAREPESLAQVGVSPLSGAGNLWLWSPQARLEQDFRFSDETGVRAQASIIQTRENYGVQASQYLTGAQSTAYYEPARPGVEGRIEFFSGSDARRIELATGIHHSVSHVAGVSVPSDVYTLDWMARPWHVLELTGTAFVGQNVTPLGTGAIRQGYVIPTSGIPSAVHSRGGWAQLTYRIRPVFWVNAFSGQQDDRDSDLLRGGIGKNVAWGGNVFYRLAPNVLASFEASQTRTTYIGRGIVLTNHYDLALGYLF